MMNLQENEPRFERNTPFVFKTGMMRRTPPRITETLRNNEEWKVEPNMRINSNKSWRRDMTDENHTYIIVESIEISGKDYKSQIRPWGRTCGLWGH